MDKKDIKTYGNGYKLLFLNDITKNDMINICLDLNKAFENKYEFEPEPIGDGFIYFKSFVNITPQKYKCMRLMKLYYETEYIPKNVMCEWLNNNDIFIKKSLNKKDKYRTFLKAFYNAEKWNKKELNIFLEVFNIVSKLLDLDILT